MTQQELAAAADCSLSYVRLLEAGFSPARSEVLTRVGVVLGLNANEARAGDSDLAKTSGAGGGHVQP